MVWGGSSSTSSSTGSALRAGGDPTGTSESGAPPHGKRLNLGPALRTAAKVAAPAVAALVLSSLPEARMAFTAAQHAVRSSKLRALLPLIARHGPKALAAA